jgi:thymidine kinase
MVVETTDNMALTLIIGPMKSGKSLEMISHFNHLQYTNIPFQVYQPIKDVRNENVWSRTGLSIDCQKISSLYDILKEEFKIVGIDEVHMFDEEDVGAIKELLNRGVKVFVSGLDMDYKGEMFGIIKKLMELGPGEVKFKKAVCEICKEPNAVYTPVFKDGKIIMAGLPSVLPEDGTYTYVPVCRKCFHDIRNN